jgi:hypothetical protein
VTPDGYVWFVRRRRARRRPFWSGRHPERFHAEEELPAERLPEPGLLDLFTTRGYDVQHPTFDWRIENDETRLFNAVVIGAAAAVAVTALLGAGRRPPAGLACAPMAEERSPHRGADRRHPRGQGRRRARRDPAHRRPGLSGAQAAAVAARAIARR